MNPAANEPVMLSPNPTVSVIITTHARPQLVQRAAAINQGVGLAKGLWTALLDDDEWLPKKLEKQLNTALSSKRAMPVAGCQFLARGGKGDILWPSRRPGEDERICD